MVKRSARPIPAEAAFRHVFETSSDAILLTDTDARTIFDANPTACRLFGYHYDELVGLRTADLIHPDSLEAYLRVAGQAHAGQALLGRRKDGSPIDGEVYARNIEQHGQVVRCIVIREITERARAYELLEGRVSQRTNQLAALLRISQALSGTLELRRLLDLVLEQLASVVEYTDALIAYQEGDELHVNAYRGPLPLDWALSLRQPVARAPMYQAVRQHGGPVVVGNAQHEPELSAGYWEIVQGSGAPLHFEPASLLGVPLIAMDKIVGILRLVHSQPYFYTQAHADLASAIANQASIAIRHARLFELGEQRREQSEALYAAEEALYRTLEPRDLLEALVHSATKLLGADKAAVLLWDQSRQQLTVQASYGFRPDTLPQMSYTPVDGLSTLAATTGEIVTSDDAQLDVRVSDRLRAIDVDEDIRGMISVPVKLGQEVFGVINLHYREPRSFSEGDQRMLHGFAQRAAMALQNARLFEAERLTRERLDVALDAGRMGTWEWDIATNAVSWSTQLEAIHGLKPGTFGGTFESYLSEVHPEDLEYVRNTIAMSITSGEHHLEYRIVWPDGSVHWLEASGRVVKDGRGYVTGLRGVCQDISARKLEERERIELQERERASSEARAALEERQRLARELHDSVSQALYGIALGSQTALAALREDGEANAADDAISYVHKLAEAAITEMRALIFELRPESLEREGLIPALERQVASVRARHGLAVQASFDAEPSIALDKKEALYRIAQEALNNVARHAHAKTIRLELRDSPGQVMLTVADDGVGFNPLASYGGHLGLVSMRERATAVGGSLSIDSAPGGGSRVTAEVHE